MKPVDQPGMSLYTADGCGPLPIVRTITPDGQALVSAWEMTREELEEIQRTGRVWLVVLGAAQPPVSIVAECPYEVNRPQ